MNLTVGLMKGALRLNAVMSYDAKERTRKIEQDRSVRGIVSCPTFCWHCFAFMAHQVTPSPKN